MGTAYGQIPIWNGSAWILNGNTNISIGYYAGKNTQGLNTVAIGYYAGKYSQGINSIAIGYYAGVTGQFSNAVAIGYQAGNSTQGQKAVAIGQQSGQISQGNNAVAIGNSAAQTSQGINAVSIGYYSGYNTQGNNAVAIGSQAGKNTQGAYSIAIGYYAGQTSQNANSIIINATSSALNNSTTSGCFIAPLTNTSTGNIVFYNNTTKELSYSSTGTITGNVTITGNLVVGNSTTGNVTAFSYNALSDARIKTNITPIYDAVTEIKKLKPIKYTIGGGLSEGFLAQDVYRNFPHMRRIPSTWDKKSSLDAPTDCSGEPLLYSLDYNRFIAYLTGAIQELSDRVDQQQKQIDELTKKNT